jgi:hypothetical protein
MRYAHLIAALLLVFVLYGVAFIENCSQCDKKNFESSGVVPVEARMRCLVDQLKRNISDNETREIFQCALRDWQHRDGAAGFAISDALLDMMEANPKLFFAMMASDQTSFNSWLQSLPALSFTWHGKPPSPLEKKRRHFIKLLKEIGELQGDAEELRGRLQATLQRIKVRQIE